MQVVLPFALVVLHAGFVLAALVARRKFGWEGVSATLWLVAAWLWLLWPVLAVGLLRQHRKALMVALLLGAALLLPTVPTVFTLTTWSVGGFAP